MKLRESGMPPQDYWESLFDVPRILDAFGFGASTGDVAELGCGYGTFTLPLAARIAGRMFAIDIEPSLVDATRQRAAAAGLTRVRCETRDVLAEGFGLPPASCEACLLFNILHGENPVELLAAARDIVSPGGQLAVIHWRTDIPTPRGPSAAIRPTAAQIVGWAVQAGGLVADRAAVDLPPWHYGLALRRVTAV